jgi:hypothetical protein
MKAIVLAAALSLVASVAYAQAPTTCKAQSAEKKLAGAAEKSFMTKCAKDAKAACDAQAKEKKLAGAAKTSFTKKCVTDATGA